MTKFQDWRRICAAAKGNRQPISHGMFLTILAAILTFCAAERQSVAEGRSRESYRGGYYPGAYYSNAYLQAASVGHGGAGGLHPKLVPYEHYGRHRLGEAFPPLATGSVLSDRFPYRYSPDFVPVAERPTMLPDPCDPAIRRRYSTAFPAPAIAPIPLPHRLDAYDGLR